MAELVTIDGQTYKKRHPLGVLGLSFITFGIYWWYWYYAINDELRRFERDETIRPGIALLAVTLGWLVIVPPFISVYNVSLHVVKNEQRLSIAQQLSPAINVILMLFIGVATGIYTQEHLDRIWETARGDAAPPPAPSGALPPRPA